MYSVVARDGEILIYNDQFPDGINLNEDVYLFEEEKTPHLGKTEFILEEDEFFVLGDNRDASLDSRKFGPVPRRLIIGKAWVRGWPLEKITIFETPEYNL